MTARFRLFLFGLLTTFALTACGATPAPVAMQGTAEDEAALRAMADRYAAAYNAGDTAAIGAMIAPNYQSVAPDGTMISGPSGVQAADAAQIKMSADMGLKVTLSITPSFVQWVNADNAVMGGRHSLAGVPAGMPSGGSWLVTATRSSTGQWLLTSSLAADYMPPPAPPAQ